MPPKTKKIAEDPDDDIDDKIDVVEDVGEEAKADNSTNTVAADLAKSAIKSQSARGKKPGVDITCTKLITKDITPTIPQNANANALLKPIVMRPHRCEFEIHGVNCAIANGIRRTICSGVAAYRLTFDIADFETNDPFMRLYDFVKDRVNAIVIDQNVPEDMVLKLDYKNTTMTNVDVCLDLFTVVSGKRKSTSGLFDPNIPIITLGADKYIKIKKITVERGYEFNHGTYALCAGVSCVPLDVEMFNMYTGKGVRSAVAAPRNHKISFETLGNIEPAELIRRACDEMSARLTDISNMLTELTPIDDYWKLVVNGAEDTCGNAIVATVCELYPDIPACLYRVDIVNKVLTITIRHQNPIDILTMSILHVVDVLAAIRSKY